MKQNRIKFTVEQDGKKLSLVVDQPTSKEQSEASKHYTKTYSELLRSGGIIRHSLDNILEEQGLWTKKQREEWEKLQVENIDIEKLLVKDTKSGLSQEELLAKAKKLKENRVKISTLSAPRNTVDANTIEGQAENVRFNFLVSVCTKYENTGDRYFKDLDDYLNQAADSEVAKEAASKFAFLFYGLDEDWQAKLPENKWLISKGYAKYFPGYGVFYVNKDGHPVDDENRLIRVKDGRYVNEKGQLVDKFGDRLDDDNNYIFDEQVSNEALPAEKK